VENRTYAAKVLPSLVRNLETATHGEFADVTSSAFSQRREFDAIFLIVHGKDSSDGPKLSWYVFTAVRSKIRLIHCMKYGVSDDR
jgi:hypothetical protein